MKKQNKIIICVLAIFILAGLSTFAYIHYSEDYEGQKLCETKTKGSVKDAKACCECIHNVLEDEEMSMKTFVRFSEDKDLREKEVFELSKEEKKFLKIAKRVDGCADKIGKNEKTTVYEVQRLIRGISMLGSTAPSYEFVNSKETLLKAYVISESLVSGDKLINRYGGDVSLTGNKRNYQIVYKDIPESACRVIRDENWMNIPGALGVREVVVKGCEDCNNSKCSIVWTIE